MASLSPRDSSPAPAKARAVVLLSGGMDSCVCAALAVRDYQPAFLHVDYGQRTERRECEAFLAIARHYGVRQTMVVRNEALARIGGSALTDSTLDVPVEGVRPGIPITYVPFRNAHFLAAAVSWAEVLGAPAVLIGAVEPDSSGYPDCRPEYYRIFNQLIEAGTAAGGIRIETPLIALRKTEIIRRGLELGAPFHLSWSCYRNSAAACGVCDSCRLRLAAFAGVGAVDPIPYETAYLERSQES